MGAASDANAAYLAIKDDADIVARVRDEHKTLTAEMLTSSTFGFDITSSTVNGQTFGGQATMTKLQRKKLLDQVIMRLDRCTTISNRTIPVFPVDNGSYSDYGDS